MAQKKITDLQLRSDFDATCNVPVDDASQTWRTTGAQILAFIKSSIAPLTTKGDLLSFGTVAQRVAGNTSLVPAILTQTGNGTVSDIPTWRPFIAPTVQKFTSGSGTYTTPANCLWMRVRLVGGGSGGGATGTGSSAGEAGAGGNTTFGSSLLVANGGAVSTSASVKSGLGGTASLGTGPVGIALQGAQGNNGTNTGTASQATGGAVSPFGGAGQSGAPASPSLVGGAAIANTGSGGGGGYPASTTGGGCGGSAGGYVDAIITAPAATYAYAVGAAGTGATAGTSGYAGGNGGSGLIIVEEFYQ